MARISRQESKDLTRQRLRAAALPEFIEHGVTLSSIDRITDAAGYSRGAFYSNYDSKIALALELFIENNDKEIAIWKEMIEGSSAPGALLQALEAQFNRLAAHRHWWALGVELRLEAGRDAAFRQLYEAADVKIVEHTGMMVRSLCHAAGCDDQVDIEYVTFVVHAFTNGLHYERSADLVSGSSPGGVLVRLLVDLLGRPAKLSLKAL